MTDKKIGKKSKYKRDWLFLIKGTKLSGTVECVVESREEDGVFVSIRCNCRESNFGQTICEHISAVLSCDSARLVSQDDAKVLRIPYAILAGSSVGRDYHILELQKYCLQRDGISNHEAILEKTKAMNKLAGLFSTGVRIGDTANKKQNSNLLAEWDDEGFARYWHFAIPIAFREALGQVYTPLLAEDDENIRPDESSSPFAWIQRETYNISYGDIFYDTRYAYKLDWPSALQSINFALKVSKSLAASKSDAGYVEADLLVPNRDKSKLEDSWKRIRLPQREFINILKFGLADEYRMELNSKP